MKADTTGHRLYAADLRKAARRLKWASAYFLTELAWKTRYEQQAEIEKGLTIRDKRFVKSRFRVDRAQGRQPIDQQIAYAGSLATARFSGWEEQEEGGRKARTATPGGRVGKAKTGKVKARARLKPGNKFLTPHKVNITNAKDERHRTIIFLRMMARRKREPFVLTGEGGIFPAGVYTLIGRGTKKKFPKISRLQTFKQNERVKTLRWNTRARATIIRRANVDALWARMWAKADVTKRRKSYK